MSASRNDGPRRKVWQAMLVVIGLTTAACGTRVSDDRIEAASYLDGTEMGVVEDTGGEGLAAGSTDVTVAGDPAAPGAPAADTGGQVATGGDAGTPAASGGGAPAGGAAGGGAGPATGSEVAIGVIGTFTGPVGSVMKDLAYGVQVWGRWVNENGGLNGHRVRVIVAEDGSTPAGFQSKAQQLVEEEGVIGFAFTTLGVTAAGNNSYLDSVGVPMFGTEGGGMNAYESPYVLTAIPVGDLFAESSMHGFARGIRERGLKKIAVLSCSDFSVCETVDKTWSNPELQRAAGLEVVYRGRPSLTQPDFTGICIDARNAGAEAILNALDSATVNRLVDSCARQGYHPIVGVPDLFGRPELSNDPDNEGLVVTTRQAPWNDMRAPGNVEMHKAFEQFAPGVQVNGSHALAWLSARFLQATASQLPADNPTAKDLLAGLAHLGNTDLGGMTHPLSFTPGQPSPRRLCFGAAVVKGGKFVPVGGPPLECR